ncbi:MAG: WD40/YVTN/BNR-like repeat-containing protein, partial [Flavobacteriales bacterium]
MFRFIAASFFSLSIAVTLSMMDFGFSSAQSAADEGHGINSGSRKYYEYLRHRDPKTGAVPVNIRQRELDFVSHLPHSNDRSLDWSHRGPFNIGGRTRAFALDVLNENTMLAGGVTGGMWKSTDGGSAWTKTTAFADIHSVSCVVQDTRPGHENTWYQGTGEESYGVVSGTSFTSQFSGNGIFKSTDNGDSWTQLFSTVSNTPENTLQIGSYDFSWNMAIDHTNLAEEEVYAAVYSGIIRSTDGGSTWQQVLGFGSAGQEFTDIMITPQGVLYATLSFANASNNGGYFRSTDGINWTEITPTGITSQRRTVMCVNPQNDNEVYFLTEIIGTSLSEVGHTLFKYTYVSGDGSGNNGTWENRSVNLPDGSCELFIGNDFEFETFRTQFSYDMCIAHHPTIPDLLFIGGININRSTSAFWNDDSEWIGGYRCNEEEPWFYVYPNHHPDQHFMVFSPSDPNVMYSANDGGLYKSNTILDPTVTWTSLNNGYSNAQFYTVHMEQGHTESDFVFGGMQDNGTWITNNTTANQNWKELHSDDGAYGALPEGRAFVITSSQQGKIFKKTMDAEGNLTGTRRIDADQGPAALFINPLILDPLNNVDLYLAGNRTIWQLPRVDTFLVNNDYLTEVDNDYWDNISESLIPVSHGSISCLDKAIEDNTIIFYGTTVGKLWRLDNCFEA